MDAGLRVGTGAPALPAPVQRVQGCTGARFRGPVSDDDRRIRVQIYVGSQIVRGTTGDLSGEQVTFVPDDGSETREVQLERVFRNAKLEDSHAEKLAKMLD